MNRFTVAPPEEPFDLPLCVTSGQVFRWQEAEPGMWIGVDGDHWYRIRVSECFEVESNASEADFERLFAMDVSQTEVVQRIAERGPELIPYMQSLSGLRLLRPTCPRETLFSFLCTANNHLARIMPMVRSLAAYGEPISGSPFSATRFPTVERIASIPESELRTKGFGYRAASIPRVAQGILERGIEIENLRSDGSLDSYRHAHETLVQLPSVGPKLADCICLIGLGHPWAAPLDTHLWQAATRLYFPELQGKAITDQRYRLVSDFLRERFGDLTGIAHQYLFYDNLLNWRSRRA